MATAGPSFSQNEGAKYPTSDVRDLERTIEARLKSLSDVTRDVDHDVKTAIDAVLNNRDSLVGVIEQSTRASISNIKKIEGDLKSNLSQDVKCLKELLQRIHDSSGTLPESETQTLIDEITQKLNSQVQCQQLARPFIKFVPTVLSGRILSGRHDLGKLKGSMNHTACKGGGNERMHLKDISDRGGKQIGLRLANRCFSSETSYLQLKTSCRYEDFAEKRCNAMVDPVRSCDEDSLSSNTSSELSSVTSSQEEVNQQLQRNVGNKEQNVHTNTCRNCSSIGDVWSKSEPNMTVDVQYRSIEENSFTSGSASESAKSSLSDNFAYPLATSSKNDIMMTELKQLNVNNLSDATCQNQTNLLPPNFSPNIADSLASLEGDLRVSRPTISCRFFTSFESKRHRTPCVIPDFTWLEDGRIVLADHYHNNIQLYDVNMTFVAEEPCQYPMGVCSVDKDVIAVTLRRNGSVAIFKAEAEQLTILRSINVICEYYLWNVVYKSHLLYVMCDENNVHNLDLYGTRRRIINTGIPPECGYIRYFDVSDDGRLLFLCTEKGLICTNRESQHLWTFTMDNLPRNLHDTSTPVLESVHFYNGRLLATHWTHSIILEISLGGNYVKHLISGGIENPRALDVRNGKLAVTHFHPTMKEHKKRTVKIFQISEN